MALDWEYCECGCHGSEAHAGPFYFWIFNDLKGGYFLHTGHGWHSPRVGKFSSQEEARGKAQEILGAEAGAVIMEIRGALKPGTSPKKRFKRIALFYRNDVSPAELAAANAVGFECVPSRMMLRKGDLVVGRYSVIPYKSIADDTQYVGATLVNTLAQHNYIADMRNWAEDLKELTPKTWYRIDEIPEDGPFVLKGKTNSRKEHWKSHMFARNRVEAIEVFERLMMDGLIGQGHQDIYVREFVPLVTYAKGINDLPITEEFRFFICDGQVLSGGFYWDSWDDTIHEVNPTWTAPSPSNVPQEFLAECMRRIGTRAEFYAIDVARTQDGRWIAIEVNDGQMSGLSANNPDVLYRRLWEVLAAKFL